MKCSILQVASETKELERLRNSDSLLRLLVDSLPAFISYIDSEQRYVFTNKLYAAFFGHELDQLKGRHINEVLGEEAYQTVRTHVETALRGLRQSYEYDLPHGGKTRHIRAIYVPHIEKGKVKGIFVLGIDMTEQKQMEQQLTEQAH